MKRFYFKIEEMGRSIYGGRYEKAIIYRLIRNKLEYLGETRKWNTASYRGAESEVNEWLLNNKIIPRTWSKCEDDFHEKYKWKGRILYAILFKK